MADEDDELPGAPRSHLLDHDRRGLLIHTVERFIENRDGSGAGGADEVPELTDGAGGQLRNAGSEPPGQSEPLRAIVLLLAGNARESADDREVIADAEVRMKCGLSAAHVSPIPGGVRVGGESRDQAPAGLRAEVPARELRKRGLARSVRPDQVGDAGPREAKRRFMERRVRATVPAGDVTELHGR